MSNILNKGFAKVLLDNLYIFKIWGQQNPCRQANTELSILSFDIGKQLGQFLSTEVVKSTQVTCDRQRTNKQI